MRIFTFIFSIVLSSLLSAQPIPNELSVWVNEAIVSTYTFDYQNYLDEQKGTAHYFTTKAWQNYADALTASQLIPTIKENKFYVSSVAQAPPEIKPLSKGIWRATMPLLVMYHNHNIEQKQTLMITIVFKAVAEPAGVRGLAIESFQSKVETPSCSCNR